MSTRQPIDLPEWSSDQDTYPYVTEPPTQQKESGWEPNQVANSGYQNWWQERVFRWIEHLDGIRLTGDANAASRLSSVYSTGTTETLNSIATDGAGTVIAVGDTGDIARLDFNAAGVLDTPAGAITDDFKAVAWDETNAVFILCGADRVIQTSPGNGTWTSRLDTGDTLNALAVSEEGIAIAVGENGLLFRSVDGFVTITTPAPIVGADWKAVTYEPVSARFYAIDDTGRIGVSTGIAGGTGIGNSWTTSRPAVGASDVVNIDYHPNWGVVSRYGDLVNVRTQSSGSGTDYTISGLLNAYGGMLLLDHSIIFYAGGAGGPAFLQIWGDALENSRVIPYATGVALNVLESLNGQIWALATDNVYSGGMI